MSRHHPIMWVLLVSVLLAACGAPAPPPVAEQPSAAPLSAVQQPGYPLPEPSPTPPSRGPSAGYPVPEPTVEVVMVPLEPTAVPPLRSPALANGPRLRERWPAPPGGTQTNAVVYLEETVDARGISIFTFIQVNLTDPPQKQTLFTIPQDGGHIQGAWAHLSPDGQWIVYFVRGAGDETFAMHVVRRDGSDDRLVAPEIGVGDARGSTKAVWSPDSTRLVFQGLCPPQAQGNVRYALSLYDVRAAGSPQQLLCEGPIRLVGWTDTSHVLILAKDPFVPGVPLDATRVDVVTGSREVLGAVDYQAFSELSPDRRRVLLNTANDRMAVYDLQQRMLTTFAEVPSVLQAVWSADSRTLVQLPSESYQAARLLTPAQPPRAEPLMFAPPASQSSRFRAQRGSPDGQYIAACEIYGEVNTPQRGMRNLVYDVAADNWQVMREGRSCAYLVGWLTTEVLQ